MGRPLVLNESVIRQLEDLIKIGNFLTVACEHVGVSTSSYHKWYRRGQLELERIIENPRGRIRKKEEIFVQFYERMNRARSFAEIQMVGRIRIASKTDARWAAWYLERSAPQRWGNKQTIQTEQLGKTIVEHTYDLSALSTEQLRALAYPNAPTADTISASTDEAE